MRVSLISEQRMRVIRERCKRLNVVRVRVCVGAPLKLRSRKPASHTLAQFTVRAELPRRDRASTRADAISKRWYSCIDGIVVLLTVGAEPAGPAAA